MGAWGLKGFQGILGRSTRGTLDAWVAWIPVVHSWYELPAESGTDSQQEPFMPLTSRSVSDLPGIQTKRHIGPRHGVVIIR